MWPTSPCRRSAGRRSATPWTRRPRTSPPSGSCSRKRASSMTPEAPPPRPVPLDRGHDLSAFDRGAPALDECLRKYAGQNPQTRSARTYVTARDNRVVGYYTLAAGSVRRDDAPPRVAKGQGNYPLPIILLARLAVDRTEQGKGLGAALLKDALLRARRPRTSSAAAPSWSTGRTSRRRRFAASTGLRCRPWMNCTSTCS